MLFKYLSLLALFSVVVAQTPNSTATSAPAATPSVSPCILGCVATAATAAGCAGPTDLQCVCTNADFQTAALACLTANCTSADLAAAQQLQQAECAAIGGASGTATGTGTGTNATTPATSAPAATSTKPATTAAATTAAASSHASSASSSATATTSSSSAVLAKANFGFLGVNGVVAVLGALVGGALVL